MNPSTVVTFAAVLGLTALAPGAQAAPTSSRSTCQTTLKVGFGPYLEKEPPRANYELRAIVYPRCGRGPRGRCAADARQTGGYHTFATVPVLPGSGRCRFILTLVQNFRPTTLRVRFLPASGFGASRASLLASEDHPIPFPTDRGSSRTGTSPATTTTQGSASGTRIVGIAFIDTSAYSRGSPLPPGTKIYPPGSDVTGASGCQTTPTNGQLVLVFDYAGPPIAAQATLTVPLRGGGTYPQAPIPMDVDAGRTVQFLGVPIPANGTYRLDLRLLGANPRSLSATFTLKRACS